VFCEDFNASTEPYLLALDQLRESKGRESQWLLWALYPFRIGSIAKNQVTVCWAVSPIQFW